MHHVDLRHFYVRRDLGDAASEEAFSLLREEIWAPSTRVRVQTQAENSASVEFWQSMGFRVASVTLELDEEAAAAQAAS